MSDCDNQDLVGEKLKDQRIAKGAEQRSLVRFVIGQSFHLRKACWALQNVQQRQVKVIQEPGAEFGACRLR